MAMLTNTNNETRYSKLSTEIQKLQKSESNLQQSLANHPNLKQQEQIIEKINNDTNQRIKLISSYVQDLENIDATNKNNLHTIKKMGEVLKVITNAENKLDMKKKELNRIKEANVNNLRLTEINTYYSQKYRAQIKILKIIALTCVPLLLIAILRQRYLLPSRTSNILATMILIISLFFVVPRFLDMSARNNMVFDEYDFTFDPSDENNPTGEDFGFKIGDKNLTQSIMSDLHTCIGSDCCIEAGLGYDSNKGECIIVKPKHKTTESFITGQSCQNLGSYLDNHDTYSKNLVTLDPTGQYYSLN